MDLTDLKQLNKKTNENKIHMNKLQARILDKELIK